MELEELRKIGLFGGLEDEALLGFAGHLPEEVLEPGAVVFREGDCGRALYVILSGEVEILRNAREDHQVRVARLGPGAWFGEMSLLDVMPRASTARVVDEAKLMKIAASDLRALYTQDPRAYAMLVLNVARELSRRLRVADLVLTNIYVDAEAYTKPRAP
jgi:CRP/FNR family cyclic AMP-dependent transcriptional regulator